MSLKRRLPFLKRRERRGARNWETDERGLTTLEWLLLVAAVGGLATIGVVVVRNAAGETKNEIDEGAEVERLQAQANSDALDGGADATNCTRPSSAWVNKWQSTFDFRWTGTTCLAHAVRATVDERLQAQAERDALDGEATHLNCSDPAQTWANKWRRTFRFAWDHSKHVCKAHAA